MKSGHDCFGMGVGRYGRISGELSWRYISSDWVVKVEVLKGFFSVYLLAS